MSPATPFQVATLVNSPTFPNAVVWSDENLIAVATGDIVTILNPEHPHSPRGVITLTPGKPFPIGVIDKADLLSGCLLPTCLSRDRQPCVRSLSWSPVGFTRHNGCLLAVCSAEGLVKVYRQPYCEFQADWIEVLNISDMMHAYFSKINYGEPEAPSSAVCDDSAGQTRNENNSTADQTYFTLRSHHKRKRDHAVKAVTESVNFQSSALQENSSVEVFRMVGEQNVWIVGTLQRLEGPMALVHFHDTNTSGEPEWLRIYNESNLPDNPGLSTANGNCGFPEIRPLIDVGRLSEQILLAEHNQGEILKAGQPVEAWSRDRWVEGAFVDFSNEGPLVKLSGDAEAVAVALNPSDVRLAPLWIAEEKSWKATVIQLHMQDSSEAVVNRSGYGKVNNSSEKVSVAKDGKTFSKRTPNDQSNHHLTAHQYASRSSMLASLVVAWSPHLQLSATDPENMCDSSCLLAVGTKSGGISIWRIHRPAYYSIEHSNSNDPINMDFMGVIHAHDAWVTALSWGFLVSDSNSQVLLASGCCDGSVRIWSARVCDLMKLSETDQTPFSLINEVSSGDNVLVSIISLYVPVQSPRKIMVAVGKGSGSFEVWKCNTKAKRSNKIGSYGAHVQAVTGLAWAFNGHCLYSCSQDNSMHGWIYHKGTLCEVSVPPNILGTRISSDHPSVSDSCYGVAVSPGNLALAVARRFDAEQLDHMYQKRTKKAGIEFFWIGGQQVDIPSIANLELDIEGISGISKEELGYWGSKLLWSLKQYECHTKHLVIWDIVAALSAFKPCAPRFVKHLVQRWLELIFKDYLNPSIRDILLEMPKHMLNISSRQLQLLNIFCRCVVPLIDFEAVKKPADSCGEKQLWVDIMLNSEKELRERLVGLSLSTVYGRISDQALTAEMGLWNPVGITQMVKWVKRNQDCVRSQLSVVSKIEGLGARLQSICDYNAEEQCSFCSATVPFESPDIATCKGIKSSGQESTQQHKLARCAVSMKVCPLTTLWLCTCCHRRASNLPPLQLITMNNFPPDILSFVKPMLTNLLPYPLCPFCGISLQRPQPDFLLSISPV